MYVFDKGGHKYIFTCVLVDEDVEITYSYWDGSGHRRTIKVKQQDNLIILQNNNPNNYYPNNTV